MSRFFSHHNFHDMPHEGLGLFFSTFNSINLFEKVSKSCFILKQFLRLLLLSYTVALSTFPSTYLVLFNQGKYFENAPHCIKQMGKCEVSTQLYYVQVPLCIFIIEFHFGSLSYGRHFLKDCMV